MIVPDTDWIVRALGTVRKRIIHSKLRVFGFQRRCKQCHGRHPVLENVLTRYLEHMSQRRVSYTSQP